MAEPCRVSFRDGRLASRKAEEAAYRRFQAANFLESVVGPLGLSPQPSEQEFVSCLRNGLILCNTINKIQPGAVSKVVTNHSSGITWEMQPLPAYQHFENVRNFLVAVDELKLPTFEASDLERDSVEEGSAAKIVDCILALKSYHQCKSGSVGSAPWKYVKSPAVSHSSGRMQLRATPLGSSVPCRRLDLQGSEEQQTRENENPMGEDAKDLLVKLLTDCMLKSKHHIDHHLLGSWHCGAVDSVTLFSKIMSSCLEDQQLQSILGDLLVGENILRPSSPIAQAYKCCNLCLGKSICNHLRLLESQENELLELKALLLSTRVDFLSLESQLQNDLKLLGIQIQGLSAAALGYHQAVKENRDLYNAIQELKGNIRVFCRIRPSFVAEAKTSIDYVGNDGSFIIVDPVKPQNTRRTFQFNRVFGPTAAQDEVYKETQPLIRSVMDGYNVCIFAYGQTGSGKTHTMFGPSNRLDKEMGVNYMALSDLFQISSSREDIMYELRVQMVEIYNEQVRDLLAEDASTTKLEIRTCSSNGGLSLPDASTHCVQSSTDVLNLMALGEKNRVFSSTATNQRSSRSHSVLTVHVQGKDVAGSIIHSCLHLVDLAGSERVDKSEVTGERLKEAQHINKSLSCLGDVIAALAQKNPHIPYRNSKLTQLLQNSLGGHAKTLMFAHVSPEGDSYGETISTLKFAQRVTTVELGRAHINKESSDIRELKEQIDILKVALANKDREKVLCSHKLKENIPITANSNQGDCTPPRPQRSSIEIVGILKRGMASHPEERKVLKSPLSRPNQTKHTPPHPRKLSTENASIQQSETASNPDERMVLKSPLSKSIQTDCMIPCPQTLSIENISVVNSGTVTNQDNVKMLKSPLSRSKVTMEHGPKSRRLSLEGSKSDKKQHETKNTGFNLHANIPGVPVKENVIHLQGSLEDGQASKASLKDEAISRLVGKDDLCPLSPNTSDSSCQNQPVNTESRSRISIQQPTTPITSRKLDEVVTPDEKAFAKSSQSKGSRTNTNTRGSQFRKSLQTIGKLINGSERRNNRCASETSSSKFGRNIYNDRSSLTTADARLRRQSLTNVHNLGLSVSRRSSLGGVSVESYSSDMLTARTPPSQPAKAMKRWL